MDTAPNLFVTPDCPVCLMQLETAGSEKHQHFVCPSCDLAFLSTARDREAQQDREPRLGDLASRYRVNA